MTYSGNSGGGYSGNTPRMYSTQQNSYSIADKVGHDGAMASISDLYRSPGVSPGNPKMYAHSDITAALEEARNIPREVKKLFVEKYVPNSAKGAYISMHTPHEYFTVDSFLKPGSTARFVGDAAEIQEDIKTAFSITTGEELPEDITISILNDKEFAKAHIAHDGATSESVQGFSINTNGRGINKVFVRANQLDKLMLTIGHEIGHILTQSLKNPHDEEAKAFAFSLAWMNTIREHNIAGIGSHILPEPAHNGLHDRAFAFVQWILDNGTRAWDAFLQLARGELTINNKLPLVEVH